MNPLGVLTGSLGAFAMGAGSVWAQIEQGAGTGDASLWVTGGGAAAVAGALVYVVRQVASGQLVHRAPHTAEQQLTDLTKRVAELVEEGHKREDDYREMLLRGGRGGHGDSHHQGPT